MLSTLPPLETDPLWELIRLFKEDKRDHKIDLVIGVYRDESGQTPVFDIVQKAEHWLANNAQSKAYKPLSGNAQFNHHMGQFLLSPDKASTAHHCTIQTVGGTGALRVLGDFIHRLSPNATVWNTDPGYINHQPIMEAAGLRVNHFRWQQKEGVLDIESCFSDLIDAHRGDILLLHGCCHNPSGIDPTFAQWQALATFCKNTGVIPLIDMAYQGFGDGPETDAAGLRWLVSQLDLVLIASSCSKNMGLYCERTGAATIVTKDTAQQPSVRVLLEHIARVNYSMPPDHGAAVAAFVFNHPEQWTAELTKCRLRILTIRQQLGSTLKALGASAELCALAKQKGMFSLLPFSAAQMQQLQEKHAIYGTSNGRINIAGLQTHQIRTLANALIDISQWGNHNNANQLTA
ncbi:aromatic amino acid transaminase [Marinomonas sp. NPDC078689]|uniref:aromatic amino acid transaminase n=1 Tax=Marinomonas sp. NPDC078689 TaxID=3364147 RepID=UPI0037C9FA33